MRLLTLTGTFILLALSWLCTSMCYGSRSAPNFLPCTVNLNSNQKKLEGGSGDKKKVIKTLVECHPAMMLLQNDFSYVLLCWQENVSVLCLEGEAFSVRDLR